MIWQITVQNDELENTNMYYEFNSLVYKTREKKKYVKGKPRDRKRKDAILNI